MTTGDTDAPDPTSPRDPGAADDTDAAPELASSSDRRAADDTDAPEPASSSDRRAADETDAAPEPASSRGRWAAALVPLAVGIVAFVNSWSLGLGTLTAPGAGLWPAGASAIMVAGSAVLLVTRPEDGERFGPGVRTIGLALVVIGLYVLLFDGVGAWPGIGFEWATVAMLAFWLRFIGRESWRLTLIVAVAVTGTLHIVFIELLKAPIPHVIGG